MGCYGQKSKFADGSVELLSTNLINKDYKLVFFEITQLAWTSASLT
jgi:hypothetical protein